MRLRRKSMAEKYLIIMILLVIALLALVISFNNYADLQKIKTQVLMSKDEETTQYSYIDQI